MHHPMAIGTQQRQISELSFVTRLERVQRFRVVDINHPLHLCTISLAEVKTTRLTLQRSMLLQRLFLFALNDFLVSFPYPMHPGERFAFLCFEETRVIRRT